MDLREVFATNLRRLVPLAERLRERSLVGAHRAQAGAVNLQINAM
jgi:hypothetical protein